MQNSINAGIYEIFPVGPAAEKDPFFCEANQKRLLRAIADLEAGRNWHEHELVEID